MYEKSLLPHHKLELMISDLEKQSQKSSVHSSISVELMKYYLSMGLFHGGGEQYCGNVLRQGQRILVEEPNNVDALSLIAMALVSMGRDVQAQQYFQKVQQLHGHNLYLLLALGWYYRSQNQLQLAIENWRKIVETAPKVWEPHLLLGRLYLHQSEDPNLDAAYCQRVGQQSLYHFIQALESNPDLDKKATFLREFGYASLLNHRYSEAEKYFNRLRQSHSHQGIASYFMGLVAFDLGKYNNAVQHFRNFLQNFPERTDVMAKQAKCFLLLQEYNKAKEACLQCLKLEQFNLEARLILGKCYLATGMVDDAMRIFIETLREHPEHLETFQVIVDIFYADGNSEWLGLALKREVEQYSLVQPNSDVDLAQLVRLRIGVLLNAIMKIGDSMISVMLEAIHYTLDENLRFALWEVAASMTAGGIAHHTIPHLEDAKKHYGLELGSVVFSTSKYIPEEVLHNALKLTDADIKQAVIDRYPSYDVQQHNQNEKTERMISRAYQALMLLSIANHQSEAAVAVLKKWDEAGDPDMSVVAKIGLAMNNDVAALENLYSIAQTANRKRLIEKIKKSIDYNLDSSHCRTVYSETQECGLCHKSGRSMHHFFVVKNIAICNHCITESQQASPALDDAICVFCKSTYFQSNYIVHHKGVDICSSCQNQSQILVEKDLVESFFTGRSNRFDM